MPRRSLAIVVIAIAIVTLLPHRASAQSASGDGDRRGDIAIGYGFRFDNGLALPGGVLMSQAWRVHPNLDLIADAGVQHGSAPLGFGRIGIDNIGLMGGIRVSSHSGFGSAARDFYQVKLGLMREIAYGQRASAADGGSSFAPSVHSAFCIEPGLGVEIGVSKKMAVRPQLGVSFIRRSDGSWRGDLGYAISAVFKTHKAK